MDNNKEQKDKIVSKSLMTRFKLFFNNSYFSNKTNLWLLIPSFVANAANWILLAIFIRPNIDNIILHYNVYFGVDVTGNWKLVFVMPGVGLILFAINLFLSIVFWKNEEKMASFVLLIATFMAQLALLIAALSVIIINY